MFGTTIGGYTRSVNQVKGMMFHERTIRPAVVEDAAAIAQVHVESWKTTYKGIFPESLLDRLSVSDRTSFWNETLAKPSARFVTLWRATKREELWGSFAAARKGPANWDVTASFKRCTCSKACNDKV